MSFSVQKTVIFKAVLHKGAIVKIHGVLLCKGMVQRSRESGG